MQFTGTELTLKRNFYTQSGVYGFAADITVDNTSGLYRFGLTGNGGSVEFVLSSGRLCYGSRFISTYRSYQEFSIEGQFTSGAANVIKDDEALMFNAPKTTGYFDYFYFSRGNDGMGATFDVEVSGNSVPALSITQQGYLLTSGQDGVTGYFANLGAFPIRVFDSNIQASANYNFGKLQSTVNRAATGVFSYTGSWDLIDLTQPILTTFNTSYQDINILFTITDARTLGRFVYVTGPTDFTFNATGILNRNLSYLNYSGGFATTAYQAGFTFQLSYVSGSGIQTGAASGFAAPVTGRFFQSGLMTGSYQGSGVSLFGWATGAATGFFSGIGTGMASGINYTGLAVGTFTGCATGFIFDGSGSVIVNYPFVGVGLNGLSLFPTGSGTFATGYIDFGSYNSADGLAINNPDSSVAFTMRAAGSPGDNPAPSCVGDGTYLMDTFSQITGIAPCISGLAGIGVNAVYNGGNIIYLTAITANVLSNDIVVSTDWGSLGDGNLRGGSNGIGPTGVAVYPIGTPYTGAFSVTITGSGFYSGTFTGQIPTYYSKSFTGSWDLLTGTNPTSLVSLKIPGQYDRNMISGGGLFDPNSQMTFQVTHNIIDNNPDGAYLVISGADVLNPIARYLTN